MPKIMTNITSKNNLTKLSVLIPLIVIASITFENVFAQTSTEPLSMYGHTIAALSFVIAGIYYSTTSFIKKFARSLNGDATVKIDYAKVARTTLLGVIIGVGAFIMAEYNGTELHITTINEFLVQVALNLAAVLTIDKLLLGGYSKPKTESNIEMIDDPDDLPPGKETVENKI